MRRTARRRWVQGLTAFIGITGYCVFAVWVTEPAKRDLVAVGETWFSGLAFSALVAALLIQAAELRAQQKQVALQLETMEAAVRPLLLVVWVRRPTSVLESDYGQLDIEAKNVGGPMYQPLGSLIFEIVAEDGLREQMMNDMWEEVEILPADGYSKGWQEIPAGSMLTLRIGFHLFGGRIEDVRATGKASMVLHYVNSINGASPITRFSWGPVAGERST